MDWWVVWGGRFECLCRVLLLVTAADTVEVICGGGCGLRDDELHFFMEMLF